MLRHRVKGYRAGDTAMSGSLLMDVFVNYGFATSGN
jgi:hypothetical protein